MTLPDLTPREHEVAAGECAAIAAYHDKLAAGGLDGSTLAAQHRMDAQAIRSRGLRHLELAHGLPRGSLKSGDEPDASRLDRERLQLAREALIATGYFTPDRVGDDVAPRITELYSALTSAEEV